MINDQQPDQGNTSVVYGSHKRLNGPDSLGNWRGGSSGGANEKQAAHEMPDHEQFVGQAGDALLFDIRTYHAGALNTLPKCPRHVSPVDVTCSSD